MPFFPEWAGRWHPARRSVPCRGHQVVVAIGYLTSGRAPHHQLRDTTSPVVAPLVPSALPHLASRRAVGSERVTPPHQSSRTTSPVAAPYVASALPPPRQSPRTTPPVVAP